MMRCMMKLDIKPETRRIVIKHATKENLTFEEALEYLIFEGAKSQDQPKNNEIFYG